MSVRTLINGTPTDQVPIVNRGLQYGDGLFETIAVRAGRPLLWARHAERLLHGAHRLGLDAPDMARLADEVHTLSATAERAVVKLLLVRRGHERGYRPATGEADRIVSLLPWPSRSLPAAGVDLVWCRTRLARQPRLAGLKHLNRLEQVLAQQELGGCREGLMQDTEDWVIAGTMANVFLVEHDALVTPRLEQAGVAGVMRAEVLATAQTLDIPARVEDVTRDRVLAADAVFLTNAVIGVWPVRSLPERRYEAPGALTRALQAALAEAGG